MQIELVEIDQFGIFKNHKLGPFSPGFNLIIGPNEAGKTTFLALLLNILFGFPYGRSNEKDYRIRPEDKLGGMLRLKVSEYEESVIIERRSGKGGGQLEIRLASGAVLETGFLDHLLSHLDLQLYKNLFAFSLYELSDFESLDSDKLQARIYSAGTGTGAVALPDLLGALEKDRKSLFTKSGKNQPINEILDRLARIEAELNALTGQIEEYDRLTARKEELSRKLNGFSEEEKKVNEKMELKRSFLRSWKNWEEYSLALIELGDLEKIPEEFPAQAEETLRRINEEIDKKKKERENYSRQIDQAKTKLITNEQFEKLISLEKELSHIERGLNQFESAIRDLPLRLSDLQALEEKLHRELRDLNPSWKVEDLLSFDSSLITSDRMRALKERIDRADKAFQASGPVLKIAEQDLSQAEEEMIRAEESFSGRKPPETGEPELLEKRLDAARELSVILRSTAQDNLQSLSDKKASLEKGLSLIKKMKVPAIISPVVFLFGAWLLAKAETLWGAVFIALGLFLSLLWWIIKVIVVRVSLGVVVGKNSLENCLAEIREKTATQEEIYKQEQERIRELSKVLGYEPDELNPVAIQTMVSKFSEEQRALNSWLEENRKLDNLKNDLERKKKIIEQRKNDQQLAGEELRQARDNFSNFKKELGLDPELSPQTVSEVFSLVERARETRSSLESLKERVSEITSCIDENSRRIAGLFATLDEPLPGPLEMVGAVKQFLELRNMARDYETDKKQLEQRIAFYSEECKRAARDLSQLEEEKKRLIAVSAHSENDPEAETRFLYQAKIARKRGELRDRFEKAHSGLRFSAGAEENLENFLGELRKCISEQSLVEEIAGLEASRTKIKEEIKITNQELGGINTSLQNLGTETRGSELRLERSVEAERLTGLAREWASLTLALKALREAASRYERDRQPEVLRCAQVFLEKMTLGRYRKIYAPLGERCFEVIGEKEIGLPPEKLSRGTAEQLYLALRFGLIGELTRHGEPLPVMMDDILVNFDPERSRAAAEAIMDMAVTHQVFYFTCHPHIVELFRIKNRKIKVLDLTGL